mmetsp:Transcript_23816/g.36811  ORF Transcript_23816/g.36811 Transcript_23816/m.36811 type:complete len:445 (+) Transcript_23816:279-1613(+)|eukprot:CAMPEP_0195284436 /NCGR_PEP_ID=MMETSP0707-20130614/2633_1 /TAXON_ID=33640 /ORGANISM="Asterionellopsis glacialis, Strain CCMP134" /LENGTH=444 /DNA_ID=CAMNT_0040343773 /DNA_START=170 /DNA_END=1504 /DNA_ORIENTATION=+
MWRVRLINLVILFSLAGRGASWVILPPRHQPVRSSHGNNLQSLSTKLMSGRSTKSAMTPLLQMANEEDSNNINSNSMDEISATAMSTTVRRLSISGVSVSQDGFWAFLQVPPPLVVASESSDDDDDDDDKGNERNERQTNNVGVLPVQVTSDPQDATAATSAESLTVLQLISGVDMAGPILPPELLARMALLYCEDFERVLEVDVDPEEATRRNKVLEWTQKTIEQSLPEGSTRPQAYTECNVWQRSKIKLPKVSLDQVCLKQQQPSSNNSHPHNTESHDVHHRWVLQCSFPDIGKVTICPTPNIVEEISYEFDNQTSTNFLCLALALRYRAPIVLETWEDSDSSGSGGGVSSSSSMNLLESQEELNEKFPMFKTVESLKDQSNRVHENIERGFEIQKLTGALRIAMEKGDKAAASMIQEKLDQFDSLDELPTIPDDFGMDEMQ